MLKRKAILRLLIHLVHLVSSSVVPLLLCPRLEVCLLGSNDLGKSPELLQGQSVAGNLNNYNLIKCSRHLEIRKIAEGNCKPANEKFKGLTNFTINGIVPEIELTFAINSSSLPPVTSQMRGKADLEVPMAFADGCL